MRYSLSMALSAMSVFSIAFVMSEKHKLFEWSLSIEVLCFSISILIGNVIFNELQKPLKNNENDTI